MFYKQEYNVKYKKIQHDRFNSNQNISLLRPKEILFFPEMQVTRKIFPWAATDLSFLIDFPEIFYFLL